MITDIQRQLQHVHIFCGRITFSNHLKPLLEARGGGSFVCSVQRWLVCSPDLYMHFVADTYIHVTQRSEHDCWRCVEENTQHTVNNDHLLPEYEFMLWIGEMQLFTWLRAVIAKGLCQPGIYAFGIIGYLYHITTNVEKSENLEKHNEQRAN